MRAMRGVRTGTCRLLPSARLYGIVRCDQFLAVCFARQNQFGLDRINRVEIRFTQSARRHRIGRSSVRFVMSNTRPTATITSGGAPAWRWVGDDERGRQLEVIAVVARRDEDPSRSCS